MHRKIPLENAILFEKICELSNISKFKIVELTQENKMNIGLLSKKVKLAFNKCSNYCSELERLHLIVKEKKGKNVFVKSKINLSKLHSLFPANI